MRSRTAVSALLALLVLLLAACGGDATAGDTAATAGDGDSVAVDVSMQDMEFVPDTVEVPAGATVEFNLTNDGNLEHDLVFDDGSDSGVVAPGGSTTFVAGPFTQDTVGWCDVPGHRESGMELEIIVAD